MKKTADKGFTLIEVLIAITILSIGILGIAGLAGTAIRSSSYSRALTQATNLGQDRIEALMSIDFKNIQATDLTAPRADLRRNCAGPVGPANRPEYTCNPVTPTITVGPTPYAWSYKVTYEDLDASGIANPAVDGLKRIDLTISWTDALWRTQKSVTFVTLRTTRG